MSSFSLQPVPFPAAFISVNYPLSSSLISPIGHTGSHRLFIAMCEEFGGPWSNQRGRQRQCLTALPCRDTVKSHCVEPCVFVRQVFSYLTLALERFGDAGGNAPPPSAARISAKPRTSAPHLQRYVLIRKTYC